MAITKKILSLIGYDLKILPPRLEINGEMYLTSGTTIELIGPTGIGKSYLFQSLEKKLQKEWYFRGQIDHDKLKQRNTYRYLSNQQEEFIAYLLQQKFANLNKIKNLSLNTKVKLYRFFLKEMEEDIYFKYSNLPKGYFSEDGITHLFTDEILDFLNDDKYKEKNEYLSQFFDSRAFVYLTASEDYIICNLKKRSIKHKNRADDWYSHYGSNRIKKFVADTLQKKDKLINTVKNFGVDVLTLNAEEPVSDNCVITLEFIDKLLVRDTK